MATQQTAAAFFELVSGRRGHFRLESGHHGGLWLDLDPLFADARRIQPLVEGMASQISRYDASVVCGPLVGGAFLAQRVAAALNVEFCFTERVLPAHREGFFLARYCLPRGIVERVRGKRVAMVDDVMSAGSALRGTYAELRAHGATPVVAGALLVLGTRGSDFFADCHVPVEAVSREPYELWHPEECPLCAKGMPLEEPSAPCA